MPSNFLLVEGRGKSVFKGAPGLLFIRWVIAVLYRKQRKARRLFGRSDLHHSFALSNSGRVLTIRF